MLSRVANSIYWLSRYLERAENISCLIYVKLHASLDEEYSNDEGWYSLVRTTGNEKDFNKKYKTSGKDAVVKFLVNDKNNINSIYSCGLVA